MKTTRLGSILSAAIAVSLMIAVTAALSHHAAAVQSAAISYQEQAPVPPPSAYSDLLNALSVGGR